VFLRNSSKKPNWLLALGMLCVSIGGALRALTVHRSPLADFAMGFLDGLGITLLVAAAWRNRCRGAIG